MKGEVEWDEVVNISCTAYNFPNGQSHESAFCLMFGRYTHTHIYVYTPTFANLLQPKL